MKERENKEEREREERRKCQRIGCSERVWENIEEEEEEENQEWKAVKKEIQDKNERESKIERGEKLSLSKVTEMNFCRLQKAHVTFPIWIQFDYQEKLLIYY